MMCFRVGCNHGVDGPGGVEIRMNVGTRGSIGTSKAGISIKFCSNSCAAEFLAAHPEQADILVEIATLCEKKK